jgi:class 3 adenylate cyclase
MACAASLVVEPPPREVRKTVTAVFCDVVGSTTLGERLDPEVLRSVMARYFDVMRSAVEGHGGTVSKFIGDAVVGVFGVPQLHEDDALRAVRAAVEMQTRLVDLNASLRSDWDGALEARIGVCTGEVVVGADDQALLGDVMNTAARLEAAAQPGGILVADETWRLVADAVSGEPVDLEVRGKAAPVRAWRLAGVNQGASGHERRFDRPLVGRDRELRTLQDAFARAAADRELQLVTITGEPGIGKTRLVAEFEAALDALDQPVTRLRGRCLAYGDGIGFWPLAEAVKQHFGIDETDSEDEARARLAAGVEGMQDAPWLRARLAPLVGLPGEAGDRDEVFTAWQRFFDEVAARTPLVLVFEDLHWADPAMLAFIPHLGEWSVGVSILVICTARPELLDQHPNWAGGLANAATLALRPLSHDDTTRLAQALLTEFVTSGDTVALVERCGGNPLYAEEYARLLADRATDASVELVMPETVRALIGARIDALAVERRSLLHDAAVVGKVFWAGALAAVGDHDPAGVRADLHELARRELIRRARTSTVPGDDEYAFWHDLVHEVAYTQIPRVRRAGLHRRVAEWIEKASGDRVADRAELLAHHYTEALALTRATGRGSVEPLRQAALRHLATAARRAMGLDAEHAARLAREGLGLATPTDYERAALLCLVGTARFVAGAHDEARALLRDARAAAEASGDFASLGEACFQEVEVAYFSGDTSGFGSLIDYAIERLSREPATGWFSLMLAQAAFQKVGVAEFAEGRHLVDRSIEVGEAVGDEQAVAYALDFRGLLRTELGDRGGLSDLEAALAAFLELGSVYVTMTGVHLGCARLCWDGPDAAGPIFAEAIEHGSRTRNTTYEMTARVNNIDGLSESGAWDDLLVAADYVLDWADSTGALQYATPVAPLLARVRALRGDTGGARIVLTRTGQGTLAMADDSVDSSRPPRLARHPLDPDLAPAALVECLDGNTDHARDLAEEATVPNIDSATPLADISRILIACNEANRARAFIDRVIADPPRLLNNVSSARALIAEADADFSTAAGLYEDAAARWRTFGNPYELAHALAGYARCLTTLNDPEGAKPLADEAAAIFQRLGVTDHALVTLRPRP